MTDLGNHSKLAGSCWWQNYAPILEEAGLLTVVWTASLTMTAGFGDGPQGPPVFVGPQVPKWYSKTNEQPLLVLENVRIVKNVFGLLDDKSKLSALETETKRSPKPEQSEFG